VQAWRTDPYFRKSALFLFLLVCYEKIVVLRMKKPSFRASIIWRPKGQFHLTTVFGKESKNERDNKKNPSNPKI